MSYDRRMVERLLPAVWDHGYDYGMQDEFTPAPDMPKARANKAHGNTLYAHLADIRRAWRKAEVPQVQRQVLVLRYGLDMPVQEIAALLGVSRKTVSRRDDDGIGRVAAWLNGDEYADDYEPTDIEEDEA